MRGWRSEGYRYVVNGLVATAVHYGVLNFNVEFLHVRSAAAANFAAACVGIAVSFIGSRFYVFPSSREPLLRLARRFAVLYGAIALLHAGVLFVWSDWMGWNYRAGFALALAIQVSLSFVGNKLFVFRT